MMTLSEFKKWLQVCNVKTGPRGNGDVVGPSASTDTEVANYNGITGKLIGRTGVFASAGVVTALGLVLTGFSGILNASSGTVSAIAPAASSVLVTSAGSVPSLAQTLPNAVQDNITRTGVISTLLTLNNNLHMNILAGIDGIMYVQGGDVTRINNVPSQILTYTSAGTPLPTTPGDGLTIDGGGILSVSYNATNLKITSGAINTIQDISTGSSPSFNALKGESIDKSTPGLWAIGTTNATSIVFGQPGQHITVNSSMGLASVSANQIVYGTFPAGLTGLATGNDGVLVTSGAGVPSISGTLPNAVQDNITRTSTLTSAVWHATAIGEIYGGTNQTSYTPGDLLQASATNTLSKLAAVATGNVLLSGGIGTVSSWGKIGTAHLTANSVTYAILQQVAASSLVGNATGSLANATGITLGTSLTFSGASINTIQDIRSSAIPTFAALSLAGTTANGSGLFVNSQAANVTTGGTFSSFTGNILVNGETTVIGINFANGFVSSTAGSTITEVQINPTFVINSNTFGVGRGLWIRGGSRSGAGTLTTGISLDVEKSVYADTTNITARFQGRTQIGTSQQFDVSDSGVVTAGTWNASVIGLTYGGLNAALTASNGGIFYSTASAGAILSGTATANQMLLSGASAAPTWSTATHPATTTINQILYSSAANVISGLATGNNGLLVTSSGGVPSISSTIPNATQDNITRLGTIASIGAALGNTFGGTGTTTTFTPTAMIFTGASGVYTQDAAFFAYDSASHRLAIGTNSFLAFTPLYIKGIVGLTNASIAIEAATSDGGALISFRAGGTEYWDIGRGIGTGTNEFSIYDFTALTNSLMITTGGNITFGNNSSSNMAFFGGGSFGGGLGTIFVANGNTVPTTNPSGGGLIYSQAGAGKWKGSGGTITTFGPAEPHCPVCSSDFGLEWENHEKYGHLQICMKCLVAGMGNKPYIRYSAPNNHIH